MSLPHYQIPTTFLRPTIRKAIARLPRGYRKKIYNTSICNIRQTFSQCFSAFFTRSSCTFFFTLIIINNNNNTLLMRVFIYNIVTCVCSETRKLANTLERCVLLYYKYCNCFVIYFPRLLFCNDQINSSTWEKNNKNKTFKFLPLPAVFFFFFIVIVQLHTRSFQKCRYFFEPDASQLTAAFSENSSPNYVRRLFTTSSQFSYLQIL